jgi:hypothetical protein
MSDSVANFFEPNQNYGKMSDSINSLFEQEYPRYNEMLDSRLTFQQDQPLALHSSTNFNQHNTTTNINSTAFVSMSEPPPYDGNNKNTFIILSF